MVGVEGQGLGACVALRLPQGKPLVATRLVVLQNKCLVMMQRRGIVCVCVYACVHSCVCVCTVWTWQPNTSRCRKHCSAINLGNGWKWWVAFCQPIGTYFNFSVWPENSGFDWRDTSSDARHIAVQSCSVLPRDLAFPGRLLSSRTSSNCLTQNHTEGVIAKAAGREIYSLALMSKCLEKNLTFIRSENEAVCTS